MPASKATVNEVVRFTEPETPTGVVVAVRKGHSRRYLVIRTDPQGRKPVGKPVWLKGSDIEGTGEFRIEPGRRYRANLRTERHGDRGCYCHCCSHVSGYLDEEE